MAAVALPMPWLTWSHERFTMTPPPSRRIASAAAREQIQAPLRSTPITSSHWRSAGHDRASPVRMSAPALLTQAWQRPNCSSVDPRSRIDLVRPRDVGADRQRVSAACHDLGHDGLGALARARVVDDDARPLPREGEGDRAADPRLAPVTTATWPRSRSTATGAFGCRGSTRLL